MKKQNETKIKKDNITEYLGLIPLLVSLGLFVFSGRVIEDYKNETIPAIAYELEDGTIPAIAYELEDGTIPATAHELEDGTIIYTVPDGYVLNGQIGYKTTETEADTKAIEDKQFIMKK